MSIINWASNNSDTVFGKTIFWVLEIGKKYSRLFKFLVVGLLNTAFGYGIFATLIWSGLHYSLAAAISTVLGVLFNFKTTGALVFKSQDNSRIVRFVLVYVVVYCANVLFLAALLSLGIDAYLAGAILILPLALFAYFMNSRFVFK